MSNSSVREFVSDVDDRIRWNEFPIYVCLAGIVTWLGILTVKVSTVHGVPPQELNGLTRTIALLTVLLVNTPFIIPTIEIGVERLR